MTESITLIKSNPLLPAEDYVALRKQGFKAIENLGSSNWTDYNNSDPGITILEAVAYAITDLAYRTGFEIKDLIAPEATNADTWKQIFYTARQILHNSPLTIDDYRKMIVDVDGVRNAWIEPSKDYEVPVWIDYDRWRFSHDANCGCEHGSDRICRGELLLTPVERSDAKAEAVAELDDDYAKRVAEIKKRIKALTEHPDHATEPYVRRIKALRERLTELKALYDATKQEIADVVLTPQKIVEFEGLYNVLVEYEEDILEDGAREEVRQRVVSRLSGHRNLCEDFLGVDAIDYVDFGIGASIELEEYADPDVVLAEIFFTLYTYFTPSIPFHTIDEMLAKGYLVDEIFEGPPLAHGFVDSIELEKTALFRDIRLSDLIGEIAAIPGIKGIVYFHLPFAGFPDPNWDDAHFSDWIDELRESRRIARVQPTKSQVVFCKASEIISYYAGRDEDRRPARMLKLFKDRKALERKYKLSGHSSDFPVPPGEWMALEDYYPVTYSLPQCYGVSKRAGLPADADDRRKAQAWQLKGYLLFFEQLLADHLVQLNHLRDLFTFDASPDRTYFTRVLDEIDGLQALVIDHENVGAEHWPEIRKRFGDTVQALAESPKVFHARRNRFLDHMLARFGEDLRDYERVERWLEPYGVDERLIEDKQNILKDRRYRGISSDRGRGYDYRQPTVWDTDNVSGAERRVSRLLGFRNSKRRTLVPSFLSSKPVMITDPATNAQTRKKNTKGQPLNVVVLVDPADNERVLLTSIEVADGCCTDEFITTLVDCALTPANLRLRELHRQRTRTGPPRTYIFELFDGSDFEEATLLGTSPQFETAEARSDALRALRAAIESIHGNEGLHLVEHLLLRPRFDEVLDEAGRPIDVSLLDICLDRCDLGIGLGEGTEVPPYRKRIERIPAARCFDGLFWILKYVSADDPTNQSLLFHRVPAGPGDPVLLKFARYEQLARRVRDLEEFGSQYASYEVRSFDDGQGKIMYGFVILDDQGHVLAQSRFEFKINQPVDDNYDPKNPKANVQIAIRLWMRYFGYAFDLYCEADDCDSDEDPYSFRATAVLPCWAGRLRDPTFRVLVENTIKAESPAHVHTRVVWVGLGEMERFERAYYDWLQAMLPEQEPSYDSVNPLVDVLNTLQPCRSCEDECG